MEKVLIDKSKLSPFELQLEIVLIQTLKSG